MYAFGIEEHVYGGSGTPTSSTYYSSLGGHLIGSTNGSSTQFSLTDALGSLLESFSDVANTASVLGNQAFGPYGNTQYQSGTLGTAKGFTGQYQDPSGLDYDTARYYDPIVGLFISADSVQSNQQGMNPYAYVGGNPETDTDPTGNYVATVNHSASAYTNPFNGNVTITNMNWSYALFDGGADATGYGETVTTYTHYQLTGYAYTPNVSIQKLESSFGYTPQAKNVLKDPHSSFGQKALTVGNIAVHTANNIMQVCMILCLGGEGILADGAVEGAEVGTEAAVDATENAVEDAEEACGGGLSFSYNTSVTTMHGQQAIGTLKVGQKVWSYNPKTKKML